ncbi:S1 family peptidase [Lysobacter sp. cf310]|uniref:S1 family peptidase n=1 Tax=Lysobacter sp. cf310 TaxID=1761790 RepID=UPI0008E34A75|nr:S1 family peptidase [Lysobacter sp. cf310]SFK69137.1 streptogrisin C [Lysobacter sp. cf310]
MSHAQRYPHRSSLGRQAARAAALVCFGFACGTAVAADTLHPLMSQAMQRDLGLALHQVTALQNLEKGAAGEEALARRAFGIHFAGSWIERQADGSYRQVVAASGAIKPSVRRAGTELRQVRHSLASLERSKDALDRNALARIPGISKPIAGRIHSWYVEPQTNSVVIVLAPGATEAGIDFVAASGADIQTVRFETREGVVEPLAQTIAGGNGYAISAKGGVFCSVGFSVTQGPHIGFATAAHCGAPNRYVFHGGETIGHFSALDEGSDNAWVAVFPGHTLLPYVNDYFAFGALLPVRGSAEVGIGASVCRSGATTGYRCGYVRAKNVSAPLSNGKVWSGLTKTDACAGRGDSGGSWLSRDQAQGVSSAAVLGGNDNCSLPAAWRETYFAPINPLLRRFGLTLTVTQ